MTNIEGTEKEAPYEATRRNPGVALKSACAVVRAAAETLAISTAKLPKLPQLPTN